MPEETTLERYQREYRTSTEGKIVRKIVKALNKSEDPKHQVVGVWDREEFEPAHTPDEVLDLLANLDEGWIITGERGTGNPTHGPVAAWVFIVNGNDWDALSDYTLDLEQLLEPVNAWIERNN